MTGGEHQIKGFLPMPAVFLSLSMLDGAIVCGTCLAINFIWLQLTVRGYKNWQVHILYCSDHSFIAPVRDTIQT
jgi:hypothetical protein